jgi:hypothetical protein
MFYVVTSGHPVNMRHAAYADIEGAKEYAKGLALTLHKNYDIIKMEIKMKEDLCFLVQTTVWSTLMQ